VTSAPASSSFNGEFMTTGSHLTSTVPDALGIWVQPAAGNSAFDTDMHGTDVHGSEQPVWQARLPQNPISASTALAVYEARTSSALQALAKAEWRLSRFTAQLFDTSYDFSAGQPQAAPERELMDTLTYGGEYGTSYAADNAADNGPSNGPGNALGNGPGSGIHMTWDQAGQGDQGVQQFLRFLDNLLRSWQQYASVETTLSADRVAWTVIGWGGTFSTCWAPEVSPDQVALHKRVVDLALCSRDSTLHLFVTATRYAIKLASTSSTSIVSTPQCPLPLLYLPAVWRFLNQVMAE
jgi:hypothetical protein